MTESTSLSVADAHLINVALELIASVQGLGHAVEVLASVSPNLADKQAAAFNEGIKRFTENRDLAISSIKALVDPHTKKT
jgi:hypothetical protein